MLSSSLPICFQVIPWYRFMSLEFGLCIHDFWSSSMFSYSVFVIQSNNSFAFKPHLKFGGSNWGLEFILVIALMNISSLGLSLGWFTCSPSSTIWYSSSSLMSCVGSSSLSYLYFVHLCCKTSNFIYNFGLLAFESYLSDPILSMPYWLPIGLLLNTI